MPPRTARPWESAASQRMSERIECPKCRELVTKGSRICPACGTGIATVRVRLKVGGKTKIIERLVACDPDQLDEFEDLEAADLDNPEELPGREH